MIIVLDMPDMLLGNNPNEHIPLPNKVLYTARSIFFVKDDQLKQFKGRFTEQFISNDPVIEELYRLIAFYKTNQLIVGSTPEIDT